MKEEKYVLQHKNGECARKRRGKGYLIILYAREGRMGLMGRDGANGLMEGRESRSQTFYRVGEKVFQDGGEICKREWEETGWMF